MWYTYVVELVTLRKKPRRNLRGFSLLKLKMKISAKRQKHLRRSSFFRSGYINICCDDKDSQHNRENEGEP